METGTTAIPPPAFESRGKVLVRITNMNVIGQVIPLLVGVLILPSAVRPFGPDRWCIPSLSRLFVTHIVSCRATLAGSAFVSIALILLITAAYWSVCTLPRLLTRRETSDRVWTGRKQASSVWSPFFINRLALTTQCSRDSGKSIASLIVLALNGSALWRFSQALFIQPLSRSFGRLVSC